MDSQEALHKAIQAIQNGDEETGRRLLAQVIRADPRNPLTRTFRVQAWLWMSSVVDSGEQQRDCLLRALALDPENERAKQALARLAAAGPDTLLDERNARSHPTEPGEEPSPRAAQMPLESTMAAVEVEPSPTTKAPQVRERGAFDVLDETQRKRGYRNIMLAGAMTLTLMCGLVLLLVTSTTVVPQAQERMRPTPESVLYTATLWCPPCEQAESTVVLWEKVGDGVSRGGKVGELPHNTSVSVLAEEWSTPEERIYFKVAAQGQKGWVPDTFIRK